MSRSLILIGAAALVASPAVAAAPNDAQIAHIAYTAGTIDVAAGRQALAKSHDPAVRSFARTMIRDHGAVNGKALALVHQLHVTPQANATSASLSKDAAAASKRLSSLRGHAFDRAYVANEVAYHRAVNDALAGTLIPSAQNAQLKALLQTGLALFKAHQAHAELLSRKIK